MLTNLQLTNSSNYYSLQATNTVSPYVSNSTWLALNVQPLTALVQLIASNYDGSSVWTDTSGNGNNATYSGGTTISNELVIADNDNHSSTLSGMKAAAIAAERGHHTTLYEAERRLGGEHNFRRWQFCLGFVAFGKQRLYCVRVC